MSDLVIGEGVALDLRLAKLPSRALARLLDLLVQAGLLGVLAAVLGIVAAAGTVDDAVMAGLMIVMTVAVVVGYHGPDGNGQPRTHPGQDGARAARGAHRRRARALPACVWCAP